MTKREFQQIVERDLATQQRNPEAVGLDWLKPLLEMEAEQDRHKLIEFILKIGQKTKTQQM